MSPGAGSGAQRRNWRLSVPVRRSRRGDAPTPPADSRKPRAALAAAWGKPVPADRSRVPCLPSRQAWLFGLPHALGRRHACLKGRHGTRCGLRGRAVEHYDLTPMAPPAAEPLIELEIRGMHCAGCAGTVERALRAVGGVGEARVNFATQQATVRLTSAGADSAARLIEAVRQAGYDALPSETAPPAAERRVEIDAALRRQRRRLIAATIIGAPVIIAHFAGHLFHSLPYLTLGLVQAVATIAVLWLAAGEMLVGAARAVVRGRGNMDLLVSLGALAAAGSGVVALILHVMGVVHQSSQLLLFDAAVMIVLFVGVGKYLEARARGRAGAALAALLTRIPREVTRVRDGRTEVVPIDRIVPGDVLRVAAQEAVPVDGVVLTGQLSIDEAMLTGEPLPVERGPDATVSGGTRAVAGLADIRATATGSTSAAARIGELVKSAQAARPPWQRLADRAAAVFVPVVLLLAAGTFIGWLWWAHASPGWALERAIAVLVVACPCALGLAVPMAVLVATTRAAERGILVRDPSALEAAGRAVEVIVDKTGTLTLGRPQLTQVVPLNGANENEVLRLSAALAQHSPHPLSQAIERAARARGLAPPAPTDFRAQSGAGLRGVVDGQLVRLGSAGYLQSEGVALDEATVRQAPVDAAASLVWLARDRQVLGTLVLADEMHPETPAAIAELRKLGVIVRLLSGDRRPAVIQLAKRLKIKAYEADMTPEQKLDRVRGLVASGVTVVMVGDGINDAPALAAASAGIALGTGADVAREAADICLVGHSPRLIPEAIRVARVSAGVMRQSLFWAAGYNVVMLPLAMLAPLPPWLASAAMMGSSLSVVANALRLRRLI